MRLKEKVCLITGAASGIGAAIAQRFAEEGAWVEIGDRDADRGRETARRIAETGGRVHFSPLDVRNRQSADAWAEDVIHRHGRIDVLVNNAGISAVGELHEVSEELWQDVMAVNVTGVFLVSRAVIPEMMRRRTGSVINMSSCIAEMGLARRAAYAASKGAVLSLTRSMQVDYARYHIRVNALLPGTIMTPFVEGYLKRDYDNPEEALALLKQRQLADDLGRPEDVADAALYLASDESRYVMGSGLVVDGGITAGKPF
ncbi:SDR family NAD(P)-dependent oxidoreductase [Sulfobacillus harzensis]|uniref:Glucose 1-dehydrogenase n=1 Tax=Sulfobacillus harzensis TaxID=2729629 RepID=A0A7Y0Q2P5_9FIRM|nr:glucose 1-dehydrogenase [Sulfobacillus harzensis]NMP21379.1 glucose 1-dehydrogenase [Sulfobacillus harzensis]